MKVDFKTMTGNKGESLVKILLSEGCQVLSHDLDIQV